MLVLSLGLLLVVGIIALSVGSVPVSPSALFDAVFGRPDPTISAILFDLRLPRMLLAVSVGGALASAGVMFQALLRNPLAEPYILGVSNGCAVGAILGYMIGAGAFGTPMLSIIGGALVVIAVLRLGRGVYGLRAESMLLAGVMVSAIAAAFIFMLLHILGPQVRSAIQWMLGDLGSARREVGYWSGVGFVAIWAVSFLLGDSLNAIALGEDEAASLGIHSERMRTVLYLLASLIVGLTVAFCGAIGFVGLVVPHIIRRIVGPDHRSLLPLSVIGGGIFVLACDALARSLMTAVDASASELPIGAVTALVGAPVFIYLLRRGHASE